MVIKYVVYLFIYSYHKIATLEAENTTLTAANTTLMAQVQNLSGGAAAGSTARDGAGAAPLITFVATPAMVNHQNFINYSTKVGTTIYNEGYKKLTTEFDMKSSGTIVYTTELQAKCIKIGWHMGTQQIINFTNAAGSTINIVHQYGQIDTATLQAQCKVFCKSTGALFQARARQNNTMMSKCIMKTLTPAARVRLLPFFEGTTRLTMSSTHPYSTRKAWPWPQSTTLPPPRPCAPI
jgi:hypothetical protein